MKLLTILKNANGYISGQQLGDTLGITRAGVWKGIQSLKEQGYEIESVTNRGYRLVNDPDILTEYELTYQLPTKFMGQKIRHYKEIGSTNDKAKEIANGPWEEGTAVVADIQTSGKGRRGKSFYSLDNSSIYASILLKPDISPVKASIITLAMGLAAVYGIRNVTGREAEIKWPNDLLIGGKKICGILTEMNAEMDTVHYIVTGFGINVNNLSFPEELKNIATSLRIELGEPVSRKTLLKEIFIQFEKIYVETVIKGGYKSLINAYKPFCTTLNKYVTVAGAGENFSGKAVDVNDKGELVIALPNGEITALFSGDVSVRDCNI